MKRNLYLMICLIGITIISCKKEDDGHHYTTPQFNKLYGGSGQDEISAIAKTSDGGYIVAGATTSTDGDLSGQNVSSKITNAWIFKLDKAGQIQWQKILQNDALIIARTIIESGDGGYLVAGMTPDASHSEGAGLVKLDSHGTISWQKILGGTNHDGFNEIINGSEGSYLITGYTQSNDGDVTGNHGGIDYWVVNIDMNGNIIWQKTYGGSDDDVPRSIAATKDGSYIIAGHTGSNDGDVSNYQGGTDGWVVKIDKEGNIIWQRTIGGSGEDIPLSITNTSDDGCVVAGYSYSTDGDLAGNHGSGDAWVEKLDENGKKVWSEAYGGSDFDGAAAIVRTADGNYMISANAKSTDGDVTNNHGMQDAWILKLNGNGKLLKQKTIGGSGGEYLGPIIKVGHDSYVLAGTSDSNNGDLKGNHGSLDAWVFTLKDF